MQNGKHLDSTVAVYYNRVVAYALGRDRHQKATELLDAATEDFDVDDCFMLLKATAQTICPTVVSMVFDAAANTVYWCENQNWDSIEKKSLYF